MKFVLIGFLFILSAAKVIPTVKDKLIWMNMNEMNAKLKDERKPVLIDLYTNWCYWCKVMDKKTYTNTKVINYINDHFYAVKLDAETKDKVQWKGKDFNFNDNYKINDFAMYVTAGQPGFPTTVIFVDENAEPVAIPGFLAPKELEPILKYFGEEAYKRISFADFNKTFKRTW